MNPKIILLSGGTGVGTSRYSFEIAKALNISSIVSTDAVREVLRSTFANGINETLGKSTYLAGKTLNYVNKLQDVQRTEIIRAYKLQSDAVNVGIEGIIKRSIEENIPTIIEGIHLRPGVISSNNNFLNNVLEFHVYISDDEVHKKRFLSREKLAPERITRKYLDNFQEIRWIHDYLLNRAHRFEEVILVDNSGSVSDGLDVILPKLHQYDW